MANPIVRSIAVIGTAGRGDDAARLTAAHFERMVTLADQVATKAGTTKLVSGGAAWADHVAVALFLRNPEKYSLQLHLPAAWDRDRFHDTGERDFRTNPGGTSNYYHRMFTKTLGRDTLAEINQALEHPKCQHTIGSGLFSRNAQVAKSDSLLAFTFGEGPVLKDGGTAQTTGTFLGRSGHGLSWHVDLNDFSLHTPAALDVRRERPQTPMAPRSSAAARPASPAPADTKSIVQPTFVTLFRRRHNGAEDTGVDLNSPEGLDYRYSSSEYFASLNVRRDEIIEERITFYNLLKAENVDQVCATLSLPSNTSTDVITKAAAKAGYDGVAFAGTNQYLVVPPPTWGDPKTDHLKGIPGEEILRMYGVNVEYTSTGQVRIQNWFSNMGEFSPPLVEDGVEYRHVENYYQAKKTNDLDARKAIAAANPYEAKKMGKSVSLRADWNDELAKQVMLRGLRHKYFNDPRYGQMLVAADPATLIEFNTWKDTKWGYDINLHTGENWLGKMHCQVQAELIARNYHQVGVVRYAPGRVEELRLGEVFVFGSNAGGFHGAGAAGYALKGTAANDWRTNPEFAQIQATAGHKGRWAVLHQARGYQEGTSGSSYAIVTVQEPGKQGSVTLDSISQEIEAFLRFAQEHKDKEFFVSKLGLSRQYGGFSFFTPDQMRQAFVRAREKAGFIPMNVHLPQLLEVRFGIYGQSGPAKTLSLGETQDRVTVANKSNIAALGPNDIYIGRSGPTPSPLQNEFTHLPMAKTKAAFGVPTRDDAVKAFDVYLYEMLKMADRKLRGEDVSKDPEQILAKLKMAIPGLIVGPNAMKALTPERAIEMREEMRRITDKAKKEPVRVVCHCCPQACHGDILKKVIERKLERGLVQAPRPLPNVTCSPAPRQEASQRAAQAPVQPSPVG